MARLGDIGAVITGNTPKTSDSENYVSNDICFVKPSDISDSEITYLQSSEFFISDSARCKARIAPENSILVTCIGIIGKVAINQVECAFNQQINAVIPDINKCLSNYVAYAIESQKDIIQGIANAAVVPIINKSQFSNIEIPLPSLDTQRHIATVLDKVSDLIALRKQQLAKLDELVKARFVEMFGDPEENSHKWEKKQLSHIIINANNGMARRGNNPDGNIVMRLVELQDGFIDYSNPNRIILNDTEKGRYLLVENDFLFARVNGNPENVGRCAVFHNVGEPVYHNDHIIRVHFDEKQLDGCFASSLFNSPYGKRQMRSQIKTSAGQYTISQDGIAAIETILPPLSLQKEFSIFVAQVDKSKSIVQQGLGKLETLKSALMQEYFG